MSNTKGRTIDQRVIAATEILCGMPERPKMITAIEREFADVVTSDPRVVALVAAALRMRLRIERRDYDAWRTDADGANAALQKFEK